MKETRVLEALRALAENDRQLSAPPNVEARLTEAFRARSANGASGVKRALRSRRVKAWVAGWSIAAAIVILLFAITNRPQKAVVAGPRLEMATARPPQPVQIIEHPTAVPEHSSGPRNSKHIRTAARGKQQDGGEIATGFFALMDPAPPLERGEILRMQVPAATMRAVGLPVSEDHLADRIQADVLVGEEGLPRAIRFVKFEMR